MYIYIGHEAFEVPLAHVGELWVVVLQHGRIRPKKAREKMVQRSCCNPQSYIFDPINIYMEICRDFVESRQWEVRH